MTTPLTFNGDAFDWRGFRLSLPPIEWIEDAGLREAIRRLYEASYRRNFFDLAYAALDLAFEAVRLEQEKADLEKEKED